MEKLTVLSHAISQTPGKEHLNSLQDDNYEPLKWGMEKNAPNPWVDD